jgi:hypothetical protein
MLSLDNAKYLCRFPTTKKIVQYLVYCFDLANEEDLFNCLISIIMLKKITTKSYAKMLLIAKILIVAENEADLQNKVSYLHKNFILS